ncbi:MAG: hypothetical protein ACYSR3_10675 [Planctomycetota bacterium]
MIIAAYMAVSAVPIVVGVFRPGVTGYKRAMLQDMVYGRAYRPFVKRQLVPIIVRAGVWILPEQLEQKLEEEFSQSGLAAKLGWPKDYAAEFILTLGVMYASLVGFLIVLKQFFSIFLNIPRWFSHLVVLLVGVSLPVTFAGQMYIYDFMQLLIFTLGILLLYEQKWSLFYPVYILACINKETSVLIPFVFLCWKGLEVLKKSNLWHFLFQVVIGFGICFLISYIFRNNPGGSMEWHLERNLNMSFSILGWARLAFLFCVIILSLWKLSKAPLFLRCGLLATLPILMVTSFLFGYIDELRAYYEALVFMTALSLFTVNHLIKVPLSVRYADE